MAIDIKFPLLVFEPSDDYSDTFLWKLYTQCRMKDDSCQLCARTPFSAVRQPPLYLWDKKTGFKGEFGFYACESSIGLFRKIMDENKEKISKGIEPCLDTIFLLSLWDIYYDPPYEYLENLEDPTEAELDAKRKAIKAECRMLQKNERKNLLRLMREGEENRIRLIISADWRKRNYKMIKEVMQDAQTVMIKDNKSSFFTIYSKGEQIGKLSTEEAEALLVKLITER